MALGLENVQIDQGDLRLAASLSFSPGITALIGPSGAGKSTLLGAIAGFLPVSRGRVTWAGDTISDLPPGERPVSILFQDQNLFPHLSVFRNVGLGMNPRLHLTEADNLHINEVLGQVGLTGFQDRLPSSLSGGEQSRVALARVLVQNRPVVLLDEPFSALGPSLKAEMLDLVRDTLSDATVVMVTHDPDDAKRIAGMAAVLSEGSVSEPIETGALFAAPPFALRAYLGD